MFFNVNHLCLVEKRVSFLYKYAFAILYMPLNVAMVLKSTHASFNSKKKKRSACLLSMDATSPLLKRYLLSFLVEDTAFYQTKGWLRIFQKKSDRRERLDPSLNPSV